MCGIVGYTGKNNGVPYLLDGLTQLEYRGYDSAGIAFFDSGKIHTVKKLGRVSELVAEAQNLCGQTGIGHTRWATHGKPSYQNAHPHTYGKFAVVHNGIIENYLDLKLSLNENFVSETDTEVISHLLQKNYNGDFLQTVAITLKSLNGFFALAILCEDYPNTVIVARRGNPILLGQGNGENYIASDLTALFKKTKMVYQLPENSIGLVNPENIYAYNCTDLSPLPLQSVNFDLSPQFMEIGKHESFMIKEIYECPRTFSDTVSNFYHNTDIVELINKISNAKKITIAGCGTAYHSAIVGKYLFERLARIPTEIDIASEYRYKNPIINKDDIFIAVSQSGETADTIAATKLAKEQGAYVVVITNVKYSSITNFADIVLTTLAGAEIGVAATKSYIGQIAVFISLAIEMALTKGAETNKYRKKLLNVKNLIENVLMENQHIRSIADEFINAEKVFFIGRNMDYAVALEGSLKLKEITYKHSEGYAAGELKHGTIALIDNKSLVIAIITQENIADKTLNAVHEVKARGASTMLITTLPRLYDTKEADCVLALPEIDEIFSPALAVIPTQLFAYHTARHLGKDPDKPRNLAKSVTVE
ncbi:MAG TPA: glutamine--fructose-6-phosphate transaminase (isomerizing) [Clostridia bacterium]|nr:glutamine--fructose-6-phosphate transaminase (isomerizing) [Clostridia bacterium]